MFTKRIIPCLDVHNGRVVKGVNFVNLQDAGDPVEIAAAYDKAGADELVLYFDMSVIGDNFKENWDYGILGYQLNISEFIKVDDFELAKTNNKEYIIVSYTGENKVINLNDLNLDGKIISISQGAFNAIEINKLILPEGLIVERNVRIFSSTNMKEITTKHIKSGETLK